MTQGNSEVAQATQNAEAPDPVTRAEWRRGAWHVSREGDDPVVLRSLTELRAALPPADTREHHVRHAPQISLVLPREVQRYVDEAEALELSGLYDTAVTCRGIAARLLRSKRMRDDDIAYCLGVTVESVRHLFAP